MELKKTRKKALALVLAACVTGTSSAPVFAAEDLFTDAPVVETPDFMAEATATAQKDVVIIYTCNGEEIKRDRVIINANDSNITADYINELPSKYGLGIPEGYEFIDEKVFAINKDNQCYVEVQKKIQETGYLQFEGMDNFADVELGSTLKLMSYHGEVPEGKVFAGWTLDGKKVYAAGESFTFDKSLAKDMGVNADGVHGYLFSFKAVYEDAKAKETGYIQFEGMDNFTEVELGSTLKLMGYHGEVPEGKVFAGWTLDGKKVYAAGESFTFDKSLAKDMGVNADGVHGYLFSFKATFDAAERKINIAFQTEAGNLISNKAMMVPYTAKYVDASKLTAPKGYKLVSEGNLKIVGDNVTAIVTKVSSSVARKKISRLSFRGVAAAYEQTGKQIRPRVTIKDGRKVLKLNRDYTVTYKNNIKRGRASIIIKGKNNYYGTKTITFRIVSKGLR